ncbi:MAG TPA: hypothetical protein VHP11_07400 [Tepidisphaeraceae bacterium]|nr:hypothetical protein [Tepidisphaeraceae bacterium]
MTQNPMATAADYADAMLVARRAKNWLVGLLLAMLVVQLAMFFLVRFERIQLKVTPTADEVVVGPGTQPTATAEPAGRSVNVRAQQFLQYMVGLIDFLGVALVIVLAFVLVLLLVIMLVGRLIGVAPVTKAFIGCLLLAVLLFPWQAFLDNVGLTSAQADFKIPGVLYTWAELAQRASFTTDDIRVAMLRWARFVGFPLAAIVLLLWVHLKSRRGLRLALGETEPANQEMPG